MRCVFSFAPPRHGTFGCKHYMNKTPIALFCSSASLGQLHRRPPNNKNSRSKRGNGLRILLCNQDIEPTNLNTGICGMKPSLENVCLEEFYDNYVQPAMLAGCHAHQGCIRRGHCPGVFTVLSPFALLCSLSSVCANYAILNQP